MSVKNTQHSHQGVYYRGMSFFFSFFLTMKLFSTSYPGQQSLHLASSSDCNLILDILSNWRHVLNSHRSYWKSLNTKTTHWNLLRNVMILCFLKMATCTWLQTSPSISTSIINMVTLPITSFQYILQSLHIFYFCGYMNWLANTHATVWRWWPTAHTHWH